LCALATKIADFCPKLERQWTKIGTKFDGICQGTLDYADNKRISREITVRAQNSSTYFCASTAGRFMARIFSAEHHSNWERSKLGLPKNKGAGYELSAVYTILVHLYSIIGRALTRMTTSNSPLQRHPYV
jgi:hypothetical protein